MLWVNRYSAPSAPLSPKGGRLVHFIDSVLDRELSTESLDGLFSVGFLTPLFGCTRFDSRWQVLDEDTRFDFVAMLATRATAPLPTRLAVLQEVVDWLLCWMQFAIRHVGNIVRATFSPAKKIR